MRKALLFFTIATFLSNAQVTSFPWTETFEDTSPTSAQWVCQYISGTNSSVTSGIFWSIKATTSVGYFSSSGPYQGAKMAVFDTRSHSRDGIAKFISPVMDLSGVSNPKLDFYYRNMLWGSDQNELKIYYRTSTTGTWTLITTFNTNVATWTNSTEITLPNPSATYQIALEGVAKYGYGLDVDNLIVKSGTLSTSESDKHKTAFKIYPNPTSDYVNITSEKTISEVSIFDLTGKQINYTKGDHTEIKIPVHQLPSGTYIIQLKNSAGILNSQKFIKK
ncbi:T9SS type A sorting domain-containing protein [Chryseobacterium sp. GP-SGM7]|uniref:T9SS type A sorting domain-containing protein n=1 Tax=Chryseobacterium sp. GP-SGM7 TaxID=3411323 RepID=UPI003B9586C5